MCQSQEASKMATVGKKEIELVDGTGDKLTTVRVAEIGFGGQATLCALFLHN
jgi:hypothetical protein